MAGVGPVGCREAAWRAFDGEHLLANELTEAQKQAVKNKLLATTSYQTFDVYYHVDPTLIGGMVIRVGDRVVDSSIRTKLEDMKKQLLNIQLG